MGAIYLALIGSVHNNKYFSMNLFRFVYIENYQRRSSQRDAFGISAGPLGGTRKESTT
jgi:hypothetical protein